MAHNTSSSLVMESGSKIERSKIHSLIYEILVSIADAHDDEITSLPPIDNELNAEALGQFIVDSSVETTVRFQIYGCDVMVDSEGRVTATEIDST